MKHQRHQEPIAWTAHDEPDEVIESANNQAQSSNLPMGNQPERHFKKVLISTIMACYATAISEESPLSLLNFGKCLAVFIAKCRKRKWRLSTDSSHYYGVVRKRLKGLLEDEQGRRVNLKVDAVC